MENVLREVNSELFEFVAKNVYETYQYLVSMEEVLEYVRLVMVDLAEKKIKVVKQGEVVLKVGSSRLFNRSTCTFWSKNKWKFC